MMEIQNSTVGSSIIDPTQPMVMTQQIEGEGSKIQPADVAISGAGGVGNGEVVKRKRGRPPRAQANLPAAKKSKEEDEDEDVCFICFDGGSLVLCDRRGCPKAYHPACIKRDEAFFRSKAKWTCGWHICSICEKAAHHMCYTCTYSLCKGCIGKSEYLCVRGDKGFCTVCMQIIMLIEKSGDATAQVDFDDKTSWEYLFKVYWVYLKGKLSLTFDELTQAKNPWKLAPVEPAKPTGSHVSTIGRRSITSELSRANLEANESKRRKTNEQTNEPLSPKDPSMDGAPKEWANKELLDFVAHMKNGDTSVLSYSDVQTLLLDYINKNNLRDPRKKSQIVCDLRLMNLFGKPRVGHIEMLKLLELQFLVKENLQKDTPTSTAKDGDTITDSKGEINVVTGGNKERRNHRRGEKRVTQNKLDEYAAIDMHNMNLIYLRRNMMESLIEDKEKFHEKAVGSIVQIRISGSDQKDDMYRLVQVVGTTKVDVPYKVRDKLVDFMLEVLNLDKKETVTIDTISNQELSEDKCRRLRESIRCGLVRCFTVGEIQEKALALQSVLLDDRIKTEMLQLNQLRDRASGNGQKKSVRECVQKLKILKTPEERARRLQEIPEIHCDPKMNPDYESDDTEEYFNNEHGDHLKPVLPWVGGTNTISPTKKVENLNDQPVEEDSSKSKTGEDAIELNHSGRPQNEADCNGSTVPKHNPEAAVASGSTPSFLSIMNNRAVDDNMWHYRDPSGNVQGPFSIVQLQRWSTSGYFPADMRIWPGQEADSLLLNNVLQEHFDNYHGWRLENAACNSEGDNQVETVTVNSQKIPEDLNSDPPSVASLTKINESTGQSDIQNMPDINQRVSTTFSVVDVSLVGSPNQLPIKESLENQIIQKMPDLPSVASLSKSNSTVQFGIQKTPDINQHVSSVFNVSDAALVNIPSPLQKKENRKNKKKQDSALKEQSKLLVQDSGMRNMLDINQHVSSAFTVTDATPVDTPSPLQKKETRKTKKVQDSVMQNMPDINHHVSSTFNVVDAAHLKLPSPLPKKETRKNKKVPDSGFKEQSNFLVQDSKIHNMPDINQHAFSVFNVADAAVADLRSPLQKQESHDNKIIQDSGLKEQPKLLVHDSGIQHMPDINQRVSSAFNVPDAALVDLPNQLQKKEDRKIKNIHDYGLKEQSKLLVQDSGIQNMPDINQHVSSVFNVADVAHVDLRNPLQKKESRKNKKIQQSGLNEQSKFLVQDSGIKNIPDIKQHVSSVFTITDAAPVDLPSSSQKSGGNRKNQKIQDSGQKEHSKLLVQDSGIQYMPDINQHVSSAFTAAYASLVDLPSPLLKKESHENQSKEQLKVLAQDSGIQDMPDINQHVSSVFTVTDAALVDLPSPFPKKESRENQKIQDSGHMEQPKFLVQDSGNLPSWSTSLSLGHEWGSYPSTVDHQVATTNNNAIEQITHLPSWHGLGETIEFSTLAEESVSDLLAEVDAMESRNCVPSPTSRRNSFLEDLFNGSMDDFSPTADQGTRGGDGFSSTADIHISRQSTGLQFSFGLEDKPTCAVSIPQTSVSSNIGFKWAEMGSSELHPPRQDMIDLNDSTRAEVDDGERETVVEKKSTTRPITVAETETRVGRKSKEKEGESIKAERSFRGFSVVEEEEGEFIQPEAAPAPPSLPQPLPPLLPTPRGLPLQPPSTGLDSVDLRRAGSGRPSQGTTSTGRVHAHTSGSSRSRNVERDSHHRRPGGDRYHSNSNSPRDRSHHVNDSGYSRSSKPSWSRQSSFGSGTSGGGSGYSRPTSKGQRVCRYFESGCCNKGSACTFLHPQER